MSALAEPVFDLYNPAIDADPYPMYAWLREKQPCFYDTSAKAWVLSRFEDVARATQDWEVYSSAQGNLIDEIPGRAGGTLGTTDPPRHDRLRALAQAAFMKKNLEHIVAPTQDLAAAALERIRARGSFDFVSEYSSVITCGLLLRVLGLPDLDPVELRDKVVLAISTDRTLKGRHPDFDVAFKWILDFIAREVAYRRQHPQDDLVTRLAEAEIDGDRLSEREVLLTTSTFVMAGVESLSSFMSTFALNMHDYPQARRRILADWSLLPQAIEESLRFNTSAQRFKRTIARDTELHGQHMKTGDKVLLLYGSANRDERKFDAPDVYDIDRKPVGHLGFGGGKHFCLGAPMARMVTEMAMKAFLEAIPEFELTGSFAWVPSSNFRSPKQLPFRIS